MGGARLGYVPSLDGLRGVAVAIVVVYHARVGTLHGGFLGVDLFFVLSGFLITAILLKEWLRADRIDFRRFYVRRVLRLFPALCLLVAVYLGATLLTSDDPMEHVIDATLVLTYISNWTAAFLERPNMLRHSWSLSIEEQFYVLWPVLLLVLLRFVRRPRVICTVIAVSALGAWLWRCALLESGAPVIRLMMGLDTRADSLLVGCTLAAVLILLRPSLAWLDRHGEWLAWLSAAGFLVLTFVAGVRGDDTVIAYLFLAALASGFLVLHLIGPHDGPLRRALEWGPLTWLGRISYGVYLWHFPLFIVFANKLGWSPLQVLLLGGPITVAAAAASFYAVEQPFLKLKRRFAS